MSCAYRIPSQWGWDQDKGREEGAPGREEGKPRGGSGEEGLPLNSSLCGTLRCQKPVAEKTRQGIIVSPSLRALGPKPLASLNHLSVSLVLFFN